MVQRIDATKVCFFARDQTFRVKDLFDDPIFAYRLLTWISCYLVMIPKNEE